MTTFPIIGFFAIGVFDGLTAVFLKKGEVKHNSFLLVIFNPQ